MGSLQRRERLAVLQDRVDQGATQPGDLSEALKWAKEGHQEAVDLKKKMAEKEGWRDLIVSNTETMRRTETALDDLEELVASIKNASDMKAKLLETMARPKVFLPVTILVLLLLGGAAGIIGFKEVDLTRVLGAYSPAAAVSSESPVDDSVSPAPAAPPAAPASATSGEPTVSAASAAPVEPPAPVEPSLLSDPTEEAPSTLDRTTVLEPEGPLIDTGVPR